ncbi:hypothetical protein COU80_00835, partial [Candidatus Peregrinibacteria bacterium CG10_big_fil_rev_8_21_14_0_10_55_24]
NEEGLVAHWTFDGDLRDRSTSGNTFTNNGGAGFVTDVPEVRTAQEEVADLSGEALAALDAVFAEIGSAPEGPGVSYILENPLANPPPGLSPLTTEGAQEEVPIQEPEAGVEQTSIPYSRCSVEGFAGSGGTEVLLRYATNEEAVGFRIMVDGEEKLYQDRGKFVSTSEGFFTVNVPREYLGTEAKSPTKQFTIEMVSTDGRVLDIVRLNGGGDVLSAPEDWEHREEGLCVDRPIEPKVSVAEIRGTAVLFALQNSHDVSRVILDGDGLLSGRTIEHAGGTELTMGTVIFRAENKPGIYCLRLFDADRRELSSVALVWNGETLVLQEKTDRWSAEATMETVLARQSASTASLTEQVTTAQAALQLSKAQAALGYTAVEGDAMLQTKQTAELYEASQWRVEFSEVYNRVRQRYPTASEETVKETAEGIWQQNMGSYIEGVGTILQSAVDVYRSAAQGGSQEAAIAALDAVITRYATSRYICEMTADTGLRLPTREEALCEGLTLFESEEALNTFAFYQSEALRLQRIGELRAQDPAYQINVLGQEGIEHDSTPAGTAENGYQGNVSESEARRLARIARKTDEVLALATSRQAQMLIALRETPNIQRDRWIASLDADALARAAAQGAGAIVAREEDDMGAPTGGVATVSDQLLALADIARGWDAVVEGVREGEQLTFGEELAQYLAMHATNLVQGFQGMLEGIQAQATVESYVKVAQGVWSVTQGTAADAVSVTERLANGDLSPVTGQGSTLSFSTNSEEQNDAMGDYALRSLKQVILGNYSDSVTAAGTAGQIALGFTGVDLPADIRDIIYDITHWEWRWGHLGQTALDGVAFLPVVGALKYGDEVHVLLRSGESEVVRLVGKTQDEIGDALITGWEKQVGHVLEKHMGLTDADLLKRLESDTTITAASTFTDERTAWNVIMQTLNENADEIAEWEKSAHVGSTKPFTFHSTEIIGRGIARGDEQLKELTSIEVWLVKLDSGGYAIKTAYPIQ